MEEISYLVANYNCAAFVAESIRSVTAQTNARWRCLVCDDCSSDDSVRVIEAEIARAGAGDRLRLLRNQHNLGYIGTLKTLLAAAETDIVAILDADDSLCLDATAEVLRVYDNDADAAFVYTRYQAIDGQSRVVAPTSPLSTPVPSGTTALLYGFVSHLKTFRRTTYYRTSGLDETIRYAEDRDLAYKLEEVTEPRFVDKVLYNYRTVSGSQSRDEEKFRVGIRNHVTARRNAVRRRGLGPADRAVHELLNQCLLARASPVGPGRRVWVGAAGELQRAIRLAVRATHHSSGRAPRPGHNGTRM